MNSYPDRLHAAKEFYPFSLWEMKGDTLEQYTPENCAKATEIFDRLIVTLISLGEGASEQAKLGAFQEAIEATNALNGEGYGNLIETGEAEDLCELCNRIAVAANLDPTRYGGGEGPASLWRDW